MTKYFNDIFEVCDDSLRSVITNLTNAPDLTDEELDNEIDVILDNLTENIDNFVFGVIENSESDGYNSGYDEGYEQGYNKGLKDAEERFKDDIIFEIQNIFSDIDDVDSEILNKILNKLEDNL